MFSILLGLGILWATLVAGCREERGADEGGSAPVATVKRYGGVYRKPLGKEPGTLDPVFTTDIYAVSIVQQLFDGLVKFDADLNVIPALARSWSASRNGLVWTFRLRQGVKFHHGREVTAHDFVYSFHRILDPQLKSPRAWLLERVQGAAAFMAGEAPTVAGLWAVDKYTLQITLSQPYAPFITMLGIAQPKVVPQEEVERLGPRFGHQPVGTGPFRLVNWIAGDKVLLEANQEYFDGRPFLDRLEYRILRGMNPVATLAEFEQGRLEEIRVVPQERQRLLNDPRYRLLRKPILATLFLWINMHEAPLNNPLVRQAINRAINRQVINSTIRQNRFVQARGILPPGMQGYNPELKGYDYNPTRARELLRAAGYPEGKGIPVLELWSSATAATAQEELEAIKRDLQHIGVTVVLHTADNWQQFTRLLGKRPGAMYRYAWYADFPDPDNFLYTLFHSQSATNYANYKNPEVDRLLEQARQEVDDFARFQLYRQAEALIVADAPTVNLVYDTLELLFQPYVHGIELNALGEPYIPMQKIWLAQTPQGSPTLTRLK
jgi:peptide/nickel transport system substrate-binding protein/oligopeptide transport system substrate-binding protein